MESMQNKLSRVRKPRVQITYEVETEGAVVEQSLPFVVGVLANLSGNVIGSPKSLRDKKFVQIDSDNFNAVMMHINPALSFTVPNTIKNDGSQMAIDLKFNSMEDFEPKNIINSVSTLKALLDARTKLRDLSTKMDRSEDLSAFLEEVMQNADELKELITELGQPSSTAGA